jgi:ParB family chromosome partitioning protein
MTDTPRWKPLGTRDVAIGNIQIAERILPPSQSRIDAMAQSLAKTGQLQPILINNAWRIVAGVTRLLAAKQLGWSAIRATIISADSEIEYQLIEIAENLDRHDLSDGERAQLKAKDKELREQQLQDLREELDKQPPVKAKGGRGKKGGLREAARKAGVPESTARDKLRGKSNPRSFDDPPTTEPPATGATVEALQARVEELESERERLLVALSDVKLANETLHGMLRQAEKEHEGVLTRAQLRDLQFVLHPDTRATATEERRDRAWHAVDSNSRLLLKEDERPALN